MIISYMICIMDDIPVFLVHDSVMTAQFSSWNKSTVLMFGNVAAYNNKV